VQLPDNSTKVLTDVRIGDTVAAVDAATGQRVWSEVYWTRTQRNVRAGLTELTVRSASGQLSKLLLTWDHLVYVGTEHDTFLDASPVMARDVRVGSVVWVSGTPGAPATGSVGKGMVLSNAVVPQTADLVTVHTLAGPVVVNGVVASSYEWDEGLKAVENAEARWMYTHFPAFAKSSAYRWIAEMSDDWINEPVVQAWRWLRGGDAGQGRRVAAPQGSEGAAMSQSEL
jgi:hypothetical protein